MPETAGLVTICVSLSGVGEPTQRPFDVTLATADDSKSGTLHTHTQDIIG